MLLPKVMRRFMAEGGGPRRKTATHRYSFGREARSLGTVSGQNRGGATIAEGLLRDRHDADHGICARISNVYYKL